VGVECTGLDGDTGAVGDECAGLDGDTGDRDLTDDFGVAGAYGEATDGLAGTGVVFTDGEVLGVT
jgi:hypothetical protein